MDAGSEGGESEEGKMRENGMRFQEDERKRGSGGGGLMKENGV